MNSERNSAQVALRCNMCSAMCKASGSLSGCKLNQNVTWDPDCVRTQAEAAAQRREMVALLLTLEGGGTTLCSPSSE